MTRGPNSWERIPTSSSTSEHSKCIMNEYFVVDMALAYLTCFRAIPLEKRDGRKLEFGNSYRHFTFPRRGMS